MARSSAAAPPRHTQMPLTATSTPSGSNTAVVVPTAARMRPQFGSLPNSAVLTRLLRATVRPTSTASSSLAAPTTSIATSFVAPSASARSCWARSWQAAVTAAVSSSAVGSIPDAPLASSSTVSLVDMQPSESIRSNVIRVAARSAASRASGPATASVVSTQSMVAMAGASMPAPLAMPPTVQPVPCATVVLGRVSVVMMASAAAGPPSRDRPRTASRTPGSSLSIGSRSPIRPVEHTATSPAPTMSRAFAAVIAAAVCSAVAWVSWKPAGPVQAFAPPELSTTARTTPPCTTCWLHSTGAALTRLAVKTPATPASGPSLITRATSGAPEDFSPAATPAARNPRGTVTLTGPLQTRTDRWSPGDPPSGWRSARPGRPRPCPGCRSR